MRVGLAILMAGLALAASGAPALAFFWMPQCHSGFITAMILSKFNWGDGHPRYRGLSILSIDGEHERLVEYFGPSPIGRRYCQGTAYLSNGEQVPVHYLIEQSMWVAGTGWNVEVCVADHDRWHVYGGNCRVLSR